METPGPGGEPEGVVVFVSVSLDDPSLSAAVRSVEKGCCCCFYCRSRPFAERSREKNDERLRAPNVLFDSSRAEAGSL